MHVWRGGKKRAGWGPGTKGGEEDGGGGNEGGLAPGEQKGTNNIC